MASSYPCSHCSSSLDEPALLKRRAHTTPHRFPLSPGQARRSVPDIVHRAPQAPARRCPRPPAQALNERNFPHTATAVTASRRPAQKQLPRTPCEKCGLKTLYWIAFLPTYETGLQPRAGRVFFLFSQDPRSGFTKATVNAWRVALQRRGSGPFPSTCESRQCASWRWRQPTTDCWPRNLPQGGFLGKRNRSRFSMRASTIMQVRREPGSSDSTDLQTGIGWMQHCCSTRL